MSSHNERLSTAEAVIETAGAVAGSTNVPGVTETICYRVKKECNARGVSSTRVMV